MMKPIYEHIKEMREDRDLKQKDVARALEISQQTYSNYENGVSELPLRHLVRLAEFYNISTDYIIGRTKFRGSVEGYNVSFTDTATVGDFLSNAMSLSDAKRKSLLQYCKFLKMYAD